MIIFLAILAYIIILIGAILLSYSDGNNNKKAWAAIFMMIPAMFIGLLIMYPYTQDSPTTMNFVKEISKTSKDSITITLQNQTGKTFKFITYQQGIDIGDTLILTPSANVIEY